MTVTRTIIPLILIFTTLSSTVHEDYSKYILFLLSRPAVIQILLLEPLPASCLSKDRLCLSQLLPT